jgi:hypothetical protein
MERTAPLLTEARWKKITPSLLIDLLHPTRSITASDRAVPEWESGAQD